MFGPVALELTAESATPAAEVGMAAQLEVELAPHLVDTAGALDS